MAADREELARRIVAGMAGMVTAKRERDDAIAAALKAGMSVREVHEVSGMSTRSVQDIGHANGWPTPAQRKKWDAEKAERDRWKAVVEQYRSTGRAPRTDSE